MPYRSDGEQGSGEVALSNRMGAIKTIESASELQKLGLVGFDLRPHPQIDPTLTTSKFLQAIRSSILQWLVLDSMDCTASDLAQVIRKCNASSTVVALKNIRLYHPRSRLLVLKELQECSKLESLYVLKGASSNLVHHGAFEVFTLKHYDDDDRTGGPASKSLPWRPREEVHKVLEYKFGRITE